MTKCQVPTCPNAAKPGGFCNKHREERAFVLMETFDRPNPETQRRRLRAARERV